ncbi:NYN domain-containing protein [Microbulbifer agarilyticus]
MKNKEKIAVFIDADNAPAARFDKILSELAKYGVVIVRKAYGNWVSSNLKPWAEILHEHAIQPMQQFDFTKGKNATDIALVIDVMDVLYTKDIDVICLVSSDCDFTPLVYRALSEGKAVLGFGERKAPKAFVNSCSRFLFLDDKESNEDICDSHRRIQLKSDTKLINLLRQAIEAVEDDEGWASLGQVGSHINNQASFDHRNYGFDKLSELFKTIDLFECRAENGTEFFVRDKKRNKRVGKKDQEEMSSSALA